jgi:hypothetical protein
VSSAVEAFVRANLPKPPSAPPKPGGIPADVLARRIDEFLGSRGYIAPAVEPTSSTMAAGPPPAAAASLDRQPAKAPEFTQDEKPTDFVCEEDVRVAIRQSRKIVIAERTIVTPAARDLAEQHRVFVQARWPG